MWPGLTRLTGLDQQNNETANRHNWPGLLQPATDNEGSGRGIHKDGTTRVVVWTEGPTVGLISDLRRCQTL